MYYTDTQIVMWKKTEGTETENSLETRVYTMTQ